MQPAHKKQEYGPVRRRICAVVLFAAAFLITAAMLSIGGRQHASSQPAMATSAHLGESGWWPTKDATYFKAYVGDSACAKCHAAEVASASRSAMTSAAFRSTPSVESGRPAPGVGGAGPYQYQFVADGDGYALRVNAGDATHESPILWTMGAGTHGQTYILRDHNDLYEGRISSFHSGHELGLTPGQSFTVEKSLEHAIGVKLSTETAARCFSCHTTAWADGNQLDLMAAIPGVHCEACHGPGAQHIDAATKGNVAKAAKAIFDPGRLPPAQSVDFCGACHRTAIDVTQSGNTGGLSSIRFQPYRLEMSRCWTKTQDARLTCVGCHNPHEPLAHDAAAYDNKCLSCHTNQVASAELGTNHKVGRVAPVCPRASNNCTSCHMQKYNLPEMHSQFTDHFIRVAKADKPFPN